MMVTKEPLTAETFLSLPRRGVIAPNSNGTIGLYNVSTHEFGKGTTKEWRVMDMATGNSTAISTDEDVHDVQWLPGSNDEVIWLRLGEEGFTDVMISEVISAGVGDDECGGRLYRVGIVEAPIEGLKIKALDDGSIALAVVCLSDDKGGMYNEKAVENKQVSTARIYDDIDVREVCLTPQPI